MSGPFAAMERVMGMSDRVWRRHANPWSGWTRLSALPLLALAGWSRVWIGWWSLPALGAAAAWIWLNPRVFPEPVRLDAWMSRGVMGERILLGHRDEVPSGHRTAATVLAWLSVPGAALMAWGVAALWWEGAVLGTLLAMLPKLWFLDRMVWLHRDWTGAGGRVPGFHDT